ncbi:AEC family transporter [Desulfosporosinus sp. FKA]|uniref:AEC family transporter n=1 Tax=Desulfosporosinus sp. FKA TaxID=1969834 RepID=UPI000B49BA26|nr:AEC family transporter [Desulfosporosinus sp. FKA]
MDIILKMFSFVTDIILPILIGHKLQKWKNVLPELFDQMIFLNLFVVSTFLNVLSFWKIQLNPELIWIPILGFLIHFIPGVFAYLTAKFTYRNPLEQGSYILSTLLSNIGVIGAISVYILFREKGYALAQLVMLPSHIILYMFCFPMAQYYYQASKNKVSRLALKDVIFTPKQVPVLGILLGLLLNVFKYPRLMIFGNIFNYTIHIRSWLYLLPIGYSLNYSQMREYWHNIWKLITIKFLVTPIVVYLIARRLISDPEFLKIMLILSCSPTAINAVVTAKLHKLNVNLAMAAFISTTIVYLVIIYPGLLLIVR